MKIEIKILNPVRLTKLFIAASRWLSKYADVLNLSLIHISEPTRRPG